MRPRATHRKPPLRTSLRLPPAVRSTRNHPALFDLTQSGPWSGAIEWRGSRKPAVADRGLGRLNWADSRPPAVAQERQKSAPKCALIEAQQNISTAGVGNRIQPFDLVSYLESRRARIYAVSVTAGCHGGEGLIVSHGTGVADVYLDRQNGAAAGSRDPRGSRMSEWRCRPGNRPIRPGLGLAELTVQRASRSFCRTWLAWLSRPPECASLTAFFSSSVLRCLGARRSARRRRSGRP